MSFQDLKFAFRNLRGSPAVTVTALITLALGIGVNTTVFSVIDAVLLRPLHYPHAERIVELGRHYPNTDGGWAVTPTNFDFWRSQSHSFAAVAATDYLPTGVNFVGKGEPERLTALGVSEDFARVFGVQPMLGRFFTEAEDKPGAGHSVVLSSGLWSSLFGKDTSILGRSVTLGGASYTVVGIMPPGFQSERPVDVWIPLQLTVDPADRGNSYRVLARLKPDVSLAQAQQDLSLVRDRFAKQYGTDLIGRNESIGAIRYQDWLARGIRPALLVLMGAVGFVLLIACANVGNLLLARSTSRRQEMAIRVALGSSTWQIVRQLLLESILLSFTGAIAGVALASFALPGGSRFRACRSGWVMEYPSRLAGAAVYGGAVAADGHCLWPIPRPAGRKSRHSRSFARGQHANNVQRRGKLGAKVAGNF
jgi:putative ABC transport system permease protein